MLQGIHIQKTMIKRHKIKRQSSTHQIDIFHFSEDSFGLLLVRSICSLWRFLLAFIPWLSWLMPMLLSSRKEGMSAREQVDVGLIMDIEYSWDLFIEQLLLVEFCEEIGRYKLDLSLDIDIGEHLYFSDVSIFALFFCLFSSVLIFTPYVSTAFCLNSFLHSSSLRGDIGSPQSITDISSS